MKNLSRSILAALILLSIVSSFAAQPILAADKKVAGQVHLDFKDIPLTDLIQTISELTGKNFLYDDRIKGTATIISPDPMTLDEAYQLFLATLNVKGYSVVRMGKTNKIVPSKQAQQNTVPRVGRSGLASDQLITRMVSLKYVDAQELASSVLAQLVPKSTRLVPYPPLNRLIISGRANNIRQILTIIRRLDVPGNKQKTELVKLQYGQATAVSEIIMQMLGESKTKTTRPRKTGASKIGNFEQPLIITPYPRANSLVVKGSALQLEQVRTLAAQLDAEAQTQSPPVTVQYLEHADAETLTKTLNEIVSGIQEKERTTRKAGETGIPKEKFTITADKPTNSVIISGAGDNLEMIQSIIAQLDVKRKQVFVEALILELSMDATEQLGASLQGAVEFGDDGVITLSSNQNTGNVNVGQFAPISDTSSIPAALTTAVSGILAGGFFNPISTTGPDGQTITVPALSVLIDLSQSNSDVNILSAPRLLTSDNEEAEIIVGSEVPIITSRLTDTGGAGSLAQSVTVERKDVALTLRLTPQITEGNQVRLNVYQEITDLAPTASSVGNVNDVGPTLTKRLVRNTVIAEDGRTIVLGGLIQSNVQNTVDKVPLLGDIPILGRLFRNEGTRDDKTNLLVFITPRIVRDPQQLAEVTEQARTSMRSFNEGKIETFGEPKINADVQLLFPHTADWE